MMDSFFGSYLDLFDDEDDEIKVGGFGVGDELVFKSIYGKPIYGRVIELKRNRFKFWKGPTVKILVNNHNKHGEIWMWGVKEMKYNPDLFEKYNFDPRRIGIPLRKLEYRLTRETIRRNKINELLDVRKNKK